MLEASVETLTHSYFSYVALVSYIFWVTLLTACTGQAARGLSIECVLKSLRMWLPLEI